MNSRMLASIVKFGLWGGNPPKELDCSNADDTLWNRLIGDAKCQGVTALLYDAAVNLPADLRPSRRLLFGLASAAQTIENDNHERMSALNRFTQDFSDVVNGKVVVVKGFSLAWLYPRPLHRECGDIDLYTGKYTDVLCSALRKEGVEVDRSDPRHDSFLFEGVRFESHSYLLYHGDDLAWETVPMENAPGNMWRLSDIQSAFFVAKHIEHHAVFFHTPVLLRSLVDWAVILHSGLNYEEFRAMAQGTDVGVFADLMTAYCARIFSFSVPFDVKCLENRGLTAEDFEVLYSKCSTRHKLAVVRVARRAGKYLRYNRKYKSIYGQSMFRRFYFKFVIQAVKQRWRQGLSL